VHGRSFVGLCGDPRSVLALLEEILKRRAATEGLGRSRCFEPNSLRLALKGRGSPCKLDSATLSKVEFRVESRK